MTEIDNQYEKDMAEEQQDESSEMVYIRGVECWLICGQWSWRVWTKGNGDIGKGYNKYDAVNQANDYLRKENNNGHSEIETICSTG